MLSALTPLGIMNKPLAILVAEDNPNVTLFFKRAFSQAGIDGPVIFGRDAQYAIDYLIGEQPVNHRASNLIRRLIILDLGMPRVTGFEELQRTRREGLCRQLTCLP